MATILKSNNPVKTRSAYPVLTMQAVDSAHAPEAGIYLVTPYFAEWALEERNTTNRPIREQKLTAVANDMQNGTFVLNGESIIFSDTGILIDGQHRLKACAMTGVQFAAVVALGIHDLARDTVDQGAPRSVGDVLSIDGLSYGKHVAAIARNMLGYERMEGAALGRLSDIPRSAIMAQAAAHPEYEVIARWASLTYKGTDGLGGAAVLATCRAILEPVYGEEAVYYLERVIKGDNLRLDSPALAARKRLFGIRNSHLAIHIILRGAVAHMEGRALTRIQLESAYPKLPKPQT